MKMTKIDSARIIVKQNGICYNYYHSETISCDDCFNGQNRKKCVNFTDEETLALAESYIKRHEGKSRKKPKPVKTVGIDNSDVTIATVKKNLTVGTKPVVKENLTAPCEHLINGDSCGNPFDHCEEDCPANSEIPQPIKFDDHVPEYVYYFDGMSKIERIAVDYFSAYKKPGSFEAFVIDVINRTYPLTDCYRTLEEAVIVAKKLWNKEVTE